MSARARRRELARRRAAVADQRRRREARAQRRRGEAGTGPAKRPVWPIVVGIGLLLGILAATWSDLTLLVSPYRSMVDTLRRDQVYVQPGAGRVDTAAIRRSIERRPIAVAVLTPGTEQAKDPGEACAAAVDRIDGLMVAVFVDGEFRYGCESDDLPLTVDWEGWDLAHWLIVGRATDYLTGDVPAQVDQVVLRYDADVADGTVLHQRRSFTVPTYRYLLAGALVVLVVAGVFAARAGLTRGVRAGVRAVVRRSRWRARQAALDAELAEVALILVDASPAPTRSRSAAGAVDTACAVGSADVAGVADVADAAGPGDPAGGADAVGVANVGGAVGGAGAADRRYAERLGRLSADYLAVLADTEHADRNTDLDELADRIAGLAERARALERA